jgi:nitrous oxide reductase accessory protein NosL
MLPAKKFILWSCLAVLLILSGPVQPAPAGEVPAFKPSPADKCPVCGMFVAKYPDFLAQITFADGFQAWFDGVKDMMKYYFDLPKYQPGKKPEDIKTIMVADYYALKPIDGLKAFYVVGSDVYGPMGRELIPFAEEAAAKEFLTDHKGQAILTFPQITPEVIKGLD